MNLIAKDRIKVGRKIVEKGDVVYFRTLPPALRIKEFLAPMPPMKYRRRVGPLQFRSLWEQTSIVRRTYRSLFRMPKEKLIRQAESQLGIIARDGRGMTKVQLVNAILERRKWLTALLTT